MQRTVIGVFGLAINHNRQVLLTRRNDPGRVRSHNKWNFPGGGMEFGESPEQTLARELQEEIQVSGRILFPHPLVRSVVHQGTHTDFSDTVQLVLFIYLISIDDQTPDFSNDPETNSYDWFTLEEVTELDRLDQVRSIVEEGYQLADKSNLWEQA